MCLSRFSFNYCFTRFPYSAFACQTVTAQAILRKLICLYVFKAGCWQSLRGHFDAFCWVAALSGGPLQFILHRVWSLQILNCFARPSMQQTHSFLNPPGPTFSSFRSASASTVASTFFSRNYCEAWGAIADVLQTVTNWCLCCLAKYNLLTNKFLLVCVFTCKALSRSSILSN